MMKLTAETCKSFELLMRYLDSCIQWVYNEMVEVCTRPLLLANISYGALLCYVLKVNTAKSVSLVSISFDSSALPSPTKYN